MYRARFGCMYMMDQEGKKTKSMRACACKCAMMVRVSVRVSGYGCVFVSGYVVVLVRVCV